MSTCSVAGVFARVTTAAVVAAILGCPAEPETPESRVRVFMTDVSRGDDDRIVASLSSERLEWLEARWRKLHSDPDPGPEALLSTTRLTALGPVETVVLVSPPGDRATVRVTVEGGASTEIRLVREQGWRVDLPRTLSVATSSAAP